MSTEPKNLRNFSSSKIFLVFLFLGPAFDIPEGTTTYPFTYVLDYNLPSTFKGTYGKIKYKMEFIVDKPWKFDEKYEVVVNIFKTRNEIYNPQTQILPRQKQITRNIGFIGGGPISLHIFTPRSFYAPGEKLQLQVIVSNFSSTHVDKVKFTLRKIIDYYSLLPNRTTRQEIEKVLRKEAGGVDKQKEQKYEHLLTIPELPATDDTASKIINIKYEIKVEVKISGLYKNLVESIPVIIASVPLEPAQMPQPPPQYGFVGIAENIPASPPISVLAQLPQNRCVGIPENMPESPPISIHSQSADENVPRLAHEVTIPSTSVAQTIGFSSSPLTRTSPLPNPRLSIISSTSTLSGASPSAPPLDFHSISPNSTRSSICSSSQWSDAPPSYDDVFGSPSSLNASFRSTKSNSTSHEVSATYAISD